MLNDKSSCWHDLFLHALNILSLQNNFNLGNESKYSPEGKTV